MRGVSKVARGVLVVSVMMSLAAPVLARPAKGEAAGRGKRDIVSVVQKWVSRLLGNDRVDAKPGEVRPTGDGLVDPWPKG